MLLVTSSCGLGDNPVVSEAEQRVGAQQHPLLLAEFGGSYAGSQATYLARVGSRIASAADLEGQCTFTLVNTDVVNAFAVPGCYIYVTRGLMSLVGSEDELASVLAHEVGHIAGEHAEQQQRRAKLRNLGVAAIGAITGSAGLTRLAGSAAAFFTLRYSRKHEFQADELGLRYLQQAGYDPFAATDMLGALDRHQAFLTGTAAGDQAKSIPEWALTHPYTENRITRTAEAAREAGFAPDTHDELEARYLRQLDGLLYGDDPEQGFVLGRRFAHPVMRIAFDAPQGFSLTNSPQSILINGPDGLRGEFGGGPLPAGGLRAYSQAVLAGLLGNVPMVDTTAEDVVVNGLPARFQQAAVTTERGEVVISVAAYSTGPSSAYHFVMVSSPEAQPQRAIAELFRSFRNLSEAEASTLRPRVIDVISARPGDTLQSLASRMASERPRDLFLALNGRAANQPVKAGEMIKLVVWR